MRMMLRTRAAAEDGFTMLLALIVLTVTTLMIAAAFVAANGDIGSSQHDLDGKRAYYAARAGLANFLYKVNKNTELLAELPNAGAFTRFRGPTPRSSSPTSPSHPTAAPAAPRIREFRPVEQWHFPARGRRHGRRRRITSSAAMPSPASRICADLNTFACQTLTAPS